jgi:Cu2+-containing amine oxidase
LVARYIANSGNYDYIFDWIFRQDGLISMKVGTSGELQTKAVNRLVIFTTLSKLLSL